MKKLVLNLAIILLWFIFIGSLDSLNLASFVLFYLFFSLMIFSEIYGINLLKNLLRVKAIYKGSLKVLLSGRVFIFFRSMFGAFFLSFSLVFNALSINKFEFLFISFVFLPIFLIVKFIVFKFSHQNLKFAKILSKNITIIISAFTLCIIWSILNFTPVSTSLNIFDYLALSSVDRSFSANLANELYSYSFYINTATSWLMGEYKVATMLLMILNKFIFFSAILYLISFISSKNPQKTGYFLGAILTLAYIYLAFVVANSLNFTPPTKESKTQNLVKVILAGNKEFLLTKDRLARLQSELNMIKERNLELSKSEISRFIDEYYESGARELAKKVGDFRYNFFTDYLILWHGVVNKNSKEYLDKKFNEFINDSFDPNFGTNLQNLMTHSINRYSLDLDRNLTLSVTSNFSTTRDFNTSLKITAGAIVGAKVLSKIAIKSAAKVGSKAALSGTSALGGVVCGAFAPVCSLALGAATWFGVDYAVAKGEESLNKDEFEAQIYSDLMREKDQFKSEIFNQLEQIYTEILNGVYSVDEI